MSEEDPNKGKKGSIVSIGPSYRIIMNFFDQMEISLKYEDLYDAKTRLKQFLEQLRKGVPVYDRKQEINKDGKIEFTTIIRIKSMGGNKGGEPSEIWGKGVGLKKNISEQNACEQVIHNLNLAGYKYTEKVSK